jgi:hypothetical protein
MTSAGLPDVVRRSRLAFAVAVLLTLLVAVIEVPTATPPHIQALAAA